MMFTVMITNTITTKDFFVCVQEYLVCSPWLHLVVCFNLMTSNMSGSELIQLVRHKLTVLQSSLHLSKVSFDL